MTSQPTWTGSGTATYTIVNDGIDLEVMFDRKRQAWVLRAFGAPNDKPFGVYPTKVEAIHSGEAVGKAFAYDRGPGGSCELFIRTKVGRIGDRRTYGHDPESSDG